MEAVQSSATDHETPWLVSLLLDEQQQLPAVERFAASSRAQRAAQQQYYRDLIPLTAPQVGEQYAFEVDLDACSGCKACVTACHNLNGLEEGELWRQVGLLIGGTSAAPVQQHVTTACHHCIDPACLQGCPVAAYEKDVATGIVRHLDDQCIGCQYCMLKCPYDVPKYSRAKGIVRKCDMCHHRLMDGEAPACVQACPNQAIRIRLVDTQLIREASESDFLLPGAPQSGYTVPTTAYKTERGTPPNLLPADYYSVQPGHSHLPLVFMLVLTQMSVGAFVIEQITYWTLFHEDVTATVHLMHLAVALMLGALGVAASILHLGRPLYAFRAILGLRSSWLSREIIAFGVFATAAAGYAIVSALALSSTAVQAAIGVVASVAGVSAVLCSVMVYVDTRRPFWSAGLTSAKFLLTSWLLGAPIALMIALLSSVLSEDATVRAVMSDQARTMSWSIVVAAGVKLLIELSIFRHLRDRQHTPLRRTALLMAGELSMTVVSRFFFGMVGGVVLPFVLLSGGALTSGSFHPLFIAVMVSLSLVLLMLGELSERYLFFVASVARRMPGAPAA